jgi:hypothetical protein
MEVDVMLERRHRKFTRFGLEGSVKANWNQRDLEWKLHKAKPLPTAITATF